MLPFLIRRSFGAAVILLLISAVTFFMYFGLPGNPAALSCTRDCTPAALEVISRNLGLDQPITTQYWEFMKGIFVGRSFDVAYCNAPCFGVSFGDDQLVWDTIVDRFPTTLSLTIGGLIVFLTIGLGTGIVAARRKGTMLDKSVSSVSLVMSSMQIYFLGPIVVGALVYSTGWFRSPNDKVGFTEGPYDWFMGFIIPWFVMAMIFTAQYTRMSRSTLIEQGQEEHVRTARAKGMSKNYVFFRYQWRGSLIPIVTILGIDLGALLGGGVVTELTFNLAGIGRLAVEAATGKDLPLLMGVMLVSAAFILVLNIIVDAAYAFIDPRVRLS